MPGNEEPRSALIYGAHLLRNGAALILDRMMERGWLTHLATNGAGTIHDWEYAWFGASTESVEMNVASGTFGTWDETSTNIHPCTHGGQCSMGLAMAVLARALHRGGRRDGADARGADRRHCERPGFLAHRSAGGSSGRFARGGTFNWARPSSIIAGSRRRSWPRPGNMGFR